MMAKGMKAKARTRGQRSCDPRGLRFKEPMFKSKGYKG